MNRAKTKIFFAIPCGEFYQIQASIIRNVCVALNVEPVIIEDDTSTKDLWKKITDAIDECDYFIADILSDSKNIPLELGYIIREKKIRYYGIFTSKASGVPSDIRGFTLQIYSSFKDFQNKLIKWIQDNVIASPKTKIEIPEKEHLDYESFHDLDKFIKLWSTSPQGSFRLTHEGLRFTNANFPMMTNYLSILQNYEFEFKAKIIKGAVGWAVKGTKSYNSFIPEFCVMFNINSDNKFATHIFNIHKLTDEGYKRFSSDDIELKKSDEGWFTILTRVEDDTFSVFNEGNLLFKVDFNEEPYKEYYSFDNKQGEIGFRCHQSEEAIINYFKVKEI